MSKEIGMRALRLEETDRVPRTEYSIDGYHYDAVRAVTGIPVYADSDPALKTQARKAFMTAWNYDFCWSTLVTGDHLKGRKTGMGHAAYAADGSDLVDNRQCPFDTPEAALALDPMSEYGVLDIPTLTADFNKSYYGGVDYFPDAAHMTGVYITCISGLIEIFGWDMLLYAAGTDPDAFGALTNRYVDWVSQYFTALIQCDSPVIMVHDDMVWTEGAFMHPDWYRNYVFPNYERLIRPLREAGKIVLFTSDGTFTKFVNDLAPIFNGFVMEPTTDMGYIAERYGKTHSFVGNADTRVLLYGTKDDIYAEVKRCMDIGKKYNGFFMAVGNHIPANTPVDACLWYNEAYMSMCKR